MTSYEILFNINFLIAVFFGCFLLQALWCRVILTGKRGVCAPGTHGIQRLIIVTNGRAMMKERKNRTIDLLSILAIIAAGICFI